MKRVLAVCVMVMLSLGAAMILPGNAGKAQASETGYETADNTVNFYAMVNSTESEINFRSGPGTGYPVITMIPNGVVLNITDLSYNSGDGYFFGRTEYNGITGWVSLRQTSILNSGGYPSPDFYVLANGSEGVVNFRTEAGTDSNVMMEIANGTVLHVTDLVYNWDDGLFFALTKYDGISGWISLRQTMVISDTSGLIGQPDEGAQTAQESGYSIVGNWRYNHHDEVPNAYYHAGYCFYADGTGLDVFWNQPFTYTTEDDVVIILFDEEENVTERFKYSFGEVFEGSQYAQYGIFLENMIQDDEGNWIPETQSGSSGNGLRRIHYGDLNDSQMASVSIHEDKSKSWDNKWIITTEDGVTATIASIDNHYNFGGGVQVIPDRINAHKVIKIGDQAIKSDLHDELIISEGILNIGSQAFLNCGYRTVTLPASIQYISEDAFYGCEKLELFYVPAGSYAEQFVKGVGLSYQLIESSEDNAETGEITTEESFESSLLYPDGKADNLKKAANAYLEILENAQSDISMVQNVTYRSDHKVADIILDDIMGDDLPEMVYVTVENEAGQSMVTRMEYFDYSHKAVSHIVTYDAKSEKVIEVLSHSFLVFDDSLNYAEWHPLRFSVYSVDENPNLYVNQVANLSGVAQDWEELYYDDSAGQLITTFETEVMVQPSQLPQVSNSTISGIIQGTVPYRIVIENYGKTTCRSYSYSDAVEYLKSLIQ